MGADGGGAQPIVREMDGCADLREQAKRAGVEEGVVELLLGEEAEEGGDVGEALEVGPGIGDTVGSDVEELVARGEDAHGQAERGNGGEGGDR